MKLKKKHFKRLKDIAVVVNQIFPGTGAQLDKLIADIESVQKVKENFSLIDIDQLRKDTVNGKVKNRPDSVANINNSRPSIQDKKKYKEYIMGRLRSQHRKDVENNIQKEGDSMVAASINEGTYTEGLRKYLSDSTDWKPLEFGGSDFTKTVEAISDPKIGDIGYFNLGSPNAPIVYGRIRNFTGNKYQDMHGNLYCGFSKTPPELK